MLKIDMDAVGRMLDEELAKPTEVIRRSEFEDVEPDYDFLDAGSRASAQLSLIFGSASTGQCGLKVD